MDILDIMIAKKLSGGGGDSVTVDDTLTVSGAAADSKTVGDKFDEMEVETWTLTLNDNTTVTKQVFVKAVSE